MIISTYLLLFCAAFSSSIYLNNMLFHGIHATSTLTKLARDASNEQEVCTNIDNYSTSVKR